MESRRTCLPLVAIGCLIASGCFFEPAINWDDRFCDPAKRTLTITAFKLIDNQVAAAPLDEKQTKAVKGRNYAIAKKNDLDALYKVLCNSNVPFGATNARGSHHISINFSCTFSDGEVLQNVADLYLFGDRTYLNICCGSDGGFQGGYFRVARLDAVLSAQTLAELRKEFLGTEEPTNYPKDFKLP